MKLLKWLPIKLVDRFLLLVAKMVLGDTEKHGLRRPAGPAGDQEGHRQEPCSRRGSMVIDQIGKHQGDLFTEDGKPKAAQEPTSWRVPTGCTAWDSSGRGLLGAGADALRAAADIAGRWQQAAGAETTASV
ncbi:hypothetical protein HU200_052590 [Digitaria exilis]|uniref:Uncharacterized protein n=1 Tax=Digitaria exilis TaxID=1010633 RepID=A0A835AQS0_9POAL|nr:hypothetical protein HU200_052590 [Digitaria exilis]